LAFARVILKFFRLALYCLLPIAYCLSLLKTSPTAGAVAVSAQGGIRAAAATSAPKGQV
jgi:hypothetical protein